jgi:hypothetical protein
MVDDARVIFHVARAFVWWKPVEAGGRIRARWKVCKSDMVRLGRGPTVGISPTLSFWPTASEQRAVGQVGFIRLRELRVVSFFLSFSLRNLLYSILSYKSYPTSLSLSLRAA